MTTAGVSMAAEIAETPAVLRHVLEGAGQWADEFRIAAGGARGVAFTARETSDHTAAYGRYLLEQALAVPAWSTAPSLVTRYRADVDVTGVLSIVISQSGRTPEIVAVGEYCTSRGATTVAVTNDPDSPLAEHADLVIPLRAGREVAVPATKTFTASLAAFASMASDTAPDRFRLHEARLVEAIAAACDDTAAIEPAVAELAGEPVIVHIGRGYLFPIAREGALKCIESVRTANLAWSPVDFRHGPYVLAAEEIPVIVHQSNGAVAGDTASLVEDLVLAGRRVVAIGEPLPGATAHVPVPGNLAEHLVPLCHAVRVQQLALSLAREAGIDPDSPVGLRKVTATS